MSENGEIYTAGKNFTLPPALMAWTNSTSDAMFTTFPFFNFRIINLGIDYVFTKLSGPCSAKLAQMWRDCTLLWLSF